MATATAHFDLTKAGSNENYNVGLVHSNFDKIDQQMYLNQTSAAKVMVGATASTDGESGRVPAPTPSDSEKYLKGDGTWDTPSGGGGGSSTLSGLTDVDLSSPTNGQVLKYNSTTQKWENANESGGGGGTSIIVVERTDNTSGYAWLTPCDANGNTLKPSEVTLLSIFAEADMSGAPPYYNGLNVCVDTDMDRYCCKLYNTQTGGYASDSVYSVTYRVAYILNN